MEMTEGMKSMVDPQTIVGTSFEFGGSHYFIPNPGFGVSFVPDADLLRRFGVVFGTPSEVGYIFDRLSNVLRDVKFDVNMSTSQALEAHAVREMLASDGNYRGVDRRLSLSVIFSIHSLPSGWQGDVNFYTKSADIARRFPDRAAEILSAFLIAHATLTKKTVDA